MLKWEEQVVDDHRIRRISPAENVLTYIDAGTGLSYPFKITPRTKNHPSVPPLLLS